MGNPNCCFMIIAGTFFSPANRRGELCFSLDIKNLDKIVRILVSLSTSKLFIDTKAIFIHLLHKKQRTGLDKKN